MRAQPVDLIGGFYKDDSLPWSAQDTVNWLPVTAEVAGTRTVKKFSTPPGLKPWQQIGTGPIRGMHDCEGLRLVVSGRYLFRITSQGIGVPIGIIPGVGRVQMTHNQFKTGFQVLIENGQGGGGYVYTTSTDTFAKITAEGYPGSISSDYLDSYILGVEPQGRFWFHSNLADATDYNTLDRYEAEASPDRIVGLAANASEVVVFGQRTIEFFINTGNATGTFQNRGSAITRGCASRHSIQKLDNTLFWLGNDGVVYRLEGYLARPISTRPLEKAISEYNWPEAVAYVWEDRGHKVYYLTFPDGQTFGYDVITGLWHRRESYGLNRWRLSHIIPWGRDWFGGDFQDGRIWQLDWDYYLEGDQPIVSARVSPALADDQNQLIVPSAELIFDTGNGPGTTPIPFPVQPNALKITGSLPNLVMGTPIEAFKYVAADGIPPYGPIVLESGSLPNGLSLAADGTVSGTPTAAGDYAWSVSVTDSDSGKAVTADSTMVVDNTQTISVAPVVSFLQGVNGGGSPNGSGEYTRDAPLDSPTVAAVGGWAALLVRSVAGDLPPLGNIPADSRVFIYKQLTPAGEEFLDPGWMGDPSHQSAMDTRLAQDGRGQYIGTITNAPSIGNSRRYLVPFIYPDGFSTQYASRLVLYYFGSRFDTAVFLQYANPSSIPAGSYVIPDLPGYYLSPSGDIYRVNWDMDP